MCSSISASIRARGMGSLAGRVDSGIADGATYGYGPPGFEGEDGSLNAPGYADRPAPAICR